ncbi:MAG TPA: hypothetical protein VH189_15240 [Rhizomicrobium sp.]|jgi:hypothetical protein|nr:hypothetical protein [Rhizomicrobium sp.]
MMFANPILRRIALAALPLCTLWPTLAAAQDQVINVYFQPIEDRNLTALNKAILTALSQPPLQLAGMPFAGVIVVVPGKVDVTKKQVSGTYYEFSVAFTRDGDSLGESAQSCTLEKLSDCTDQLVQDVKSVAAQHTP